MKKKTILISAGLLILLVVLVFFIQIEITGNVTSNPCDDRDGGLNPFVASYVFTDWSDGYNPYMDECINSTHLKEAVCNSNFNSQIVRCNEGCKDARCLEESNESIYLLGRETNFSLNCGDNSYYASDVLIEIEEQYNSEGEALLNQPDYKGMPTIVEDVLISSYTGDNIIARMMDTDPNGCDVYVPNTNPCISPIMEIGRIRLEESFYLHPWTNPRTLSDGSSATALSENFFLNMGEWIRFILDHEFTHTIYYHRYLNETIGQYEDRINSYAIENMLNYRLNCSQLSYLDDDLNRKIIYPSEDFGIESNKEYSIICEENTRQNVEAFAFTPSCVTAKIENESLPNEPQEPNGDLNLTNNLTRYNSNITNTDNSSDEETLSQDLAPADTNYSESLKGYTNSKSQEDNGSIIDTKQQKENLIIKIVNWFKRLFR